MTIEEAIRLLIYDETISRLIPDYDFYNKMRLKEVRQIAVSALEKQIPKKPYKDSDWYYCEECRKKGMWNVVGEPNGKYGITIDRHCSYCGQAQDWEQKEITTEIIEEYTTEELAIILAFCSNRTSTEACEKCPASCYGCVDLDDVRDELKKRLDG